MPPPSYEVRRPNSEPSASGHSRGRHLSNTSLHARLVGNISLAINILININIDLDGNININLINQYLAINIT
jgi:hypothetical protein